jgi:hypothetical protein
MLILNFTYPLRCLRVPPVEYHWSKLSGFNSQQGQRREFFSAPPHAHRLWGPLRLLSNEYQRLFSWG